MSNSRNTGSTHGGTLVPTLQQVARCHVMLLYGLTPYIISLDSFCLELDFVTQAWQIWDRTRTAGQRIDLPTEYS